CITISVHARTTVSATLGSYAVASIYLILTGFLIQAGFLPGYELSTFLLYLTVNLFVILITLVSSIGALRSATLGLPPPGTPDPVRPRPETLARLLTERKRLVPHPETGLVVLSDWNPFLDPSAQQFEPPRLRHPLA